MRIGQRPFSFTLCEEHYEASCRNGKPPTPLARGWPVPDDAADKGFAEGRWDPAFTRNVERDAGAHLRGDGLSGTGERKAVHT